jgi:hypothetical protein
MTSPSEQQSLDDALLYAKKNKVFLWALGFGQADIPTLNQYVADAADPELAAKCPAAPKALPGTAENLSEQIQDIIKSWTNSDGTKKDTQSPLSPKLDPVTYKRLNTFIQEIMDQYEPGTVFKSEVKIFDQKTNIAGSIDLLIVKPDGFVDIYDWKTQQIFEDQTDLKSYKEPMYRIQLENYRKILEL